MLYTMWTENKNYLHQSFTFSCDFFPTYMLLTCYYTYDKTPNTLWYFHKCNGFDSQIHIHSRNHKYFLLIRHLRKMQHQRSHRSLPSNIVKQYVTFTSYFFLFCFTHWQTGRFRVATLFYPMLMPGWLCQYIFTLFTMLYSLFYINMETIFGGSYHVIFLYIHNLHSVHISLVNGHGSSLLWYM